MRGIKAFAALLLALSVAACATKYQEASFLDGGGFSVKQIEPGYWRVTFTASPATTRESIQTYWLYRAASLAHEQGYDGFTILSDFHLAGVPVQIAHGGAVFVPIFVGGGGGQPPQMEGDIKLLKSPFDSAPPKTFDAALLMNQLDPYVNGPKCERGNVCPHVHRYLLPKGGDG